MSFKTNPITNRFNLNKGWKSSTFPETLACYSRDNVFLFKLFLFIKAYFDLLKIKLITCELRLTEGQTHLLFLVINTTTKKKKKKLQFARKKAIYPSGASQSPFLKPQRTRAMNLLFSQLPYLKQQLGTCLMPFSKTKFTHFWSNNYISPARINHLAILITERKNKKKALDSFHVLKLSCVFSKNLGKNLEILSLTKQQIIKEFLICILLFKILKKKINSKWLNKQFHISFFHFYQKKLKLIQQKLQTLKKIINYLQTKFCVFRAKNQNQIQSQFTKRMLKKKNYIQQQILLRLLKNQNHTQKNFRQIRNFSKLKKNLFSKRLLKMNLFRYFWTDLKKIIPNLRIRNTRLSFLKKWQIFSVILLSNSIRPLKNKFNHAQLDFIHKNLSKNQNHRSLLWKNKLYLKKANIKFFRKLRRPFLFEFYKKLRINKKQHAFLKLHNFKINSKKIIIRQFTAASKKRINNLSAITSRTGLKPIDTSDYRINFRNTYRKHLRSLLRYRYKFALKTYIKGYIKINFNIKIIQPLIEHKNLKFFRLIFPQKDVKSFNKHWQTQKLQGIKQKVLNKENQEKPNSKSLKTKNNYLFLGLNSVKLVSSIIVNSNPVFKQITNYRISKRPSFYKKLRQKTIREYAPTIFRNSRNKLLMQSFLPAAVLFIKYLNPQLLADHLAKEFEKTKRHNTVIYAMKAALRSLRFSRAKGYRIAIRGRFNSAEKTRTFCLARNLVSCQTFSQKVNFAYAQSRARIGSFGIKVWVFY